MKKRSRRGAGTVAVNPLGVFWGWNKDRKTFNDYKLKETKKGNLYLATKNDFGELRDIYLFKTFENKVHVVDLSFSKNYDCGYYKTDKYPFKRLDICDILIDRGMEYLIKFNDNNHYTFRGDVSIYGYYVNIDVSDLENNYYGNLKTLDMNKKIDIENIIYKVNKHSRNKNIDDILN